MPRCRHPVPAEAHRVPCAEDGVSGSAHDVRRPGHHMSRRGDGLSDRIGLYAMSHTADGVSAPSDAMSGSSHHVRRRRARYSVPHRPHQVP